MLLVHREQPVLKVYKGCKVTAVHKVAQELRVLPEHKVRKGAPAHKAHKVSRVSAAQVQP